MIGLAACLLMSFSSSDDEDLIEWIDARGNARALRGKITEQDDTSIYMSRRDGDWEIARKQVTKVERRSTTSKGLISRAIDASRQKEESLRQAIFTKVFETASALREAEDQGAGPERIAELRKALDQALRE